MSFDKKRPALISFLHNDKSLKMIFRTAKPRIIVCIVEPGLGEQNTVQRFLRGLEVIHWFLHREIYTMKSQFSVNNTQGIFINQLYSFQKYILNRLNFMKPLIPALHSTYIGLKLRFSFNAH